MATSVPISPEIWKLANDVLTDKQLTVFELREKHGLSWHQIAIYTNRTKANARNHYEAATKKIYDELERRQ
jgi:transcriptional regulator